MNLDINTLFLVTIYVEAILGLLLLFAWIQNLQIRAVAWWGCAHLMRAGSIVLFGMYGSVSQAISIDLANALLFLVLRRDLDRRARVRRPQAAAAVDRGRTAGVAGRLSAAGLRRPSSSSASCSRPASSRPTRGSRPTNSGAGANEPLVSRWPAIFMLFAHGSMFLLRTPLAAMLPWSPTSQVFESVWLTVLSFEALMFTISIAFILLAMAKERTEFRHRTAAMVDPLTGIANRRSFLNDASELTKPAMPQPPVRRRCC